MRFGRTGIQRARTGQSHGLSLLSTSQQCSTIYFCRPFSICLPYIIPLLFLLCIYLPILAATLYSTLPSHPRNHTCFLYHYLPLCEPAPAPLSASFNNNSVRPFNHSAPRLALIGLDVHYPVFIRQPLRTAPTPPRGPTCQTIVVEYHASGQWARSPPSR